MSISFTKFLTCITLTLLSGLHTRAQSSLEFNDINKKYRKGLISNVEYIAYADSVLTDLVFVRGVSISNDSLVDILSVYKKIVTSDNQFVKQRGLYYYFLASNANNQNLGGMMMYYSDKYRSEIGRNSYRATIPLSFRLNYHYTKKQYSNILKLYENEKQYLDKQIDSIFNGPSFDARYKTILGIYYVIGEAANNKQKSGLTEDILNTVLIMHSKLLEKKEADPFIITISNLYVNLHKVNSFLHYGKLDSVNSLLKKSINELNTYKDNYPDEVELYSGYAKEALIKYYKKTNQPKGVLGVLEAFEFPYIESKIYKSKEKGLAYSSLGNYKDASKMFLETVNLQEVQLLDMANEINSLLYSYIDSERNRENLDIAQRDKRIRMILIITIASASIIIIGLLFYLFTSQRRKLGLLNKTTEIQINEATQRASKEERNKIGQDLHDGLSGSIAGILYRMEDIRIKSGNSELSSEIDDVYDKLQEIYKEKREKSHLNFNALHDTKEDFLDDSIRKIVDSALRSSIKKDVNIDKRASVFLNAHSRVELLRIAQEAMANIVKHAKKVNEVSVYLYELDTVVILEINNDGVVPASTSHDGIGIQSIKSRVMSLGGKIHIEREKNSFQIEIKLPKNTLPHN